MVKKNANNICEFVANLHDLCVKYNIYPSGDLRIRQGTDWDRATFDIKTADELDYMYAKDRGGPFLRLTISPVDILHKFTVKKSKIALVDKDYLLRNGVKSQADGKVYGNRREYNDHLKRHDMVEVGDQAPIHAPKEIRGDFECRKELHEAIKQHLG